METLLIGFFPFPYVLNGDRHEGYQFSWPERCNQCDRQCERIKGKEIMTCSYGVNYRWFDDLLVFGFLINEPGLSSAQKKMIRGNPQNVVTVAAVERAAAVHAASAKSFENDIRNRQAAIIRDYVALKRYEKDFLEILKPEFEKSFSFVHDYKQFIARVRQNINVVLEDRYPGGDLNDKLNRAKPAETAIYWASLLMEEKLKTAFFLLNPALITGSIVTFRLHGAVLKYIRIYNAAFAEKNVTVQVSGESVGEIKGNPTAVPVIAHTLIDNALKYSKRGSDVRIEFDESKEEIELRVTSYGPQIESGEVEKIFELFYRGTRARIQEEEGAGFGLYLAQFIAKTMGTRITVAQTQTMSKFGYKTTFAVKFRRER